MRTIAATLALTAALLLGACSSAQPANAPEPEVTQDALLAAASAASTNSPVAIAGYVFIFRRESTDASGTVKQELAEIVVTKDGEVLREKPDDFFHGATDGKFLETPVERLEPETETERQARVEAQRIAVESDTGTARYGAIEPFVRRYLIEDASGNLFYLKPDGSEYSAAPELVSQ